jgi:sugar phosphate isomerase/epimerase
MVDGESVPVLPGDPDGVDFDDVFGALKTIGFDGFVTHMSGPHPDMDNRSVCEAFVERLRPLL